MSKIDPQYPMPHPLKPLPFLGQMVVHCFAAGSSRWMRLAYRHPDILRAAILGDAVGEPGIPGHRNGLEAKIRRFRTLVVDFGGEGGI